jgi:tight adherence protein B
MDKLTLVLQVCAVLVVFYVIYLTYKYFLSLVKKNRLADFSLEIKESNSGNLVYIIIKRISKFLKNIKVLKKYAKKFDEYAILSVHFRDGYDFLSTKILVGLGFSLLYVFVSALYRVPIMLIVIIVLFILGYVIPDFYCIYLKTNTNRLLDKNLLSAIIIMNNDFRANRSVEQAIRDVIDRTDNPVSSEFKRVLADTKVGLSYGEAFERLFNRTNSVIVEKMSYSFYLYQECGTDLIEIFENLEKELIENEKLANEISFITSSNRLFRVVFTILPVVFIISLLVMNNNIGKLMNDVSGLIVIAILFLLFLLYLLGIKYIVRRYDYDK